MPTYDQEVLTDTPQGYWKLEEISGETVMVDSSGNDRDGTLLHPANPFTNSLVPLVYGVGGPIETDAYNVGMSGGVGHAPEDSALDTVNAFTWEIWGFNSATETAGTAMLMTRANLGAGTQGSRIQIQGQTITGVVRVDSTGATAYAVDYGNQLPWGTWFHIVLTRNGTVLRLYVNGILRDERTDLPTDTVTLTEAFWGISANPPGSNSASSWGVARAAIYNTALSASRVLAHYEAAKAVLPLRATITINLALELNTDQIVPSNLGFPHNYSQTFGDGQIPIIEELEYRTNVNQSEPDYQQRVSARPHGAYRTLEYHLSPTSGAARARLQGHLYSPAQFYCVPVWSDSGVLTGTATSGTNTLSVDTTKRDYEIGSYVGICSDLQNPATYQFFKITARTDSQLTLDANISTTVASGSPVFPARVASLSDDHFAVKSFAADHEDFTFRFEVIESELSTRRITAYTPGTTYLSTEVFTLETAKVNFLDDRPYDIARRIQSKGRDYQFAKDTGSPQTFPVRFLLTTRAALSEFYGWLDARQGKLNPLFVSTKERDLIPSAGTGTTITVAKTGFSLHHGRRHLEFLKTDSTMTRARVTAIEDLGDGTERWTVTSPAFATIAKVSFLKYCVLASDTVRINYFKGGANGSVIAECSLSMRELLTSPS